MFLCVFEGAPGDKISEDIKAKVRQSERFGRWVVIKDEGDMQERRQRKKKKKGRYKLNMSQLKQILLRVCSQRHIRGEDADSLGSFQ